MSSPRGQRCQRPAPAPVVYANHEMTHRIADLVFGAVAQGYPERALACSQGTSAILTLGGQDPRTGQRYVSYETLGGGMGARLNQDGINAVKAGISNTMNTPVEELEMRFPRPGRPLRNRPRQWWCRRVPRGLRRPSRMGASWATPPPPPSAASAPSRLPLASKVATPARPTSVHVVEPQGNRDTRNSKGPAFPVLENYSIAYDVAGAGGYGNPQNRNPQSIHQDLIQPLHHPRTSRPALQHRPLNHALQITAAVAQVDITYPSLIF